MSGRRIDFDDPVTPALRFISNEKVATLPNMAGAVLDVLCDGQ